MPVSTRIALMILFLVGLCIGSWRFTQGEPLVPPGRTEILFWHFWGGDEGVVVEDIVRGFNASQETYWVRAVAMPGNNLDVKLFLAVAGGMPPDLVNQDDPILGDWGSRDAILPLSEIVPPAEYASLRTWLFPAAFQLGAYHGELYGLCNGLDVRALFFNKTLLDDKGLTPPQTIDELDQLTDALAPDTTTASRLECIPFLPNPRNLWAWGILFGGRFVDSQTQKPTLTDPAIARALAWMAGYGKRFGTVAAALRSRDQSLAGKVFPLLVGHYVLMEDGQWRCRDIARFQKEQERQGEDPVEIGVIPFPPPADATGRPVAALQNAGWINGNFFLVPRGCRHPEGTWQFMKYWSGFGGHEAIAAEHCVAGGWIPASQAVVNEPVYASYLIDQPLFKTFVELAGSPHQIPRPNLPGGLLLDREVRYVAEQAMLRGEPESAARLLEEAQQRLESQLPVAGVAP